MRKLLLTLTAAFSLIAAAPSTAPADSIDAIARDYVVLVLNVKDFAPDLVGVSDPPPALVADAKAAKGDRGAVNAGLAKIIVRIDRLPASSNPLIAMRARSLRAHAVSLQFQLRSPESPRPSVAEQVRLTSGFEPEFPPLTQYDPAIAQLDNAMPGQGELSERIEALKAVAIVPKNRVEPVVRTAIAECRKRAAMHRKMPKESIEVRFVDDPLVPGQSEYLGNGRGVITVSTAVPADVDRLLSLACHEAYPGHHTNYATLDEQLFRHRGWPEFSVELAETPQFPVSDAISEYGIGLTFPVEDRIAFERDVLYPLAGLSMQNEPAWRALIQARSSVLGATSTIVRDYLEHRIDVETAKKLFIRYRLQNRRSAEQMIKMLDAFGPFVIASDAGWYTVDRVMQGKSVDERWRLLQRMESEPMLLEDVAALR